MVNKVHEYIIKNNMLQVNDKIVLGVSGGADSVCLLFLMLELVKKYNLELFVVHINHGIRGEESDGDEAFVRNLCEKENISFYCKRANISEIAKNKGISEEEAGRILRYETFNIACEKYGCNKIATAHNRNDSVETILFNLFRGSGIRGLTGISPVREMIIRPLLCVKREEIESYLRERNESFQTDSTNLEEIYSRNKIRLTLLPFVHNEINSKAEDHIINSGVMLKEIEEYIESNSIICYNKIVRYERDDGYSFFVKDLAGENIVIQKSIIRKIIYQLVNQLKDIKSDHIGIVLDLLTKGVGKSVDLPYGLIAIRGYDSITIAEKKIQKTEQIEIETIIPGEYYLPWTGMNINFELKDYKRNLIIPKNSYTKWFDYDKIDNTVFIRTRKTGDFIEIDSEGSRKRIKSLFVDEKVLKEKRNSLPLLADGNHIIWVIGGRISERYKVDCNTKRILIVNVYGGNLDVRQN